MPKSQQPIEGQRLMIEKIIGHAKRVLDVGAGDGKWGLLLAKAVPYIAAIEIWPAYIEQFKLRTIYDHVIVGDVRDFVCFHDYDTIILGDVLEHMPRADAIELCRRLKKCQAEIYLTIPITECIQDGAMYGNPYETHIEQWSDKELIALGWRQIHVGPNPNGLVQIGTYQLEKSA